MYLQLARVKQASKIKSLERELFVEIKEGEKFGYTEGGK